MKYKIDSTGLREDSQNSDVLRIAISPGEIFKSRSSSVLSYGGDIKTSTSTTRSMWRAVTSFENYPITKIKAESSGNGGVVTLTPPIPGEIGAIEPQDKDIKVVSLGFLGAPNQYSIDLKRSDLFQNDSLATLNIQTSEDSDVDKIFVGGFQGITAIELSDGERTHISEDHVLALDGSLEFNRSSGGGIKDTAFDTHATPTLDVTGPGTVYMHSRSPFKMKRVFEKIEDY